MSTRRLAMAAFLCLCISNAQNAFGAERGVIRPVRTWQGEISMEASLGIKRLKALRTIASVHMVADQKTWQWVWRTLKGDDQKVPEVDFHQQIVFVSLQPGVKKLKLSLLHNGKGNVVSLIAGYTTRYDAGYVMASIPRQGLKTVDGRRIPKPPRRRRTE